MVEVLREIVARNKAGNAVALPSVCSAHPEVLRASLRMAQRLGKPIVIEATSNQVNQHGGYMGLQPIEFIEKVRGYADDVGADRGAIVFGGDHLGTQVWRGKSPAEAMAEARILVKNYVKSGFSKIHLDCSEGCAGEPAQLADAQTAERSAELARACLEVADDLLFVVGTEVPPPGGARADETHDIPATKPDAARTTLAAHDEAFGPARDLIGGLVVQPGVEFNPTAVHHFPMDRDPGLRAAIEDWPAVCLEAHSTDYQNHEVFPRLAQLGFAFQKVGPALTFAYREALYALDFLGPTPGALPEAVEKAMLDNQTHWEGHYHGSAKNLKQLRHFGLADRVRYYWPTPEVQRAVDVVMTGVPMSLPDSKLQASFDDTVLSRAENLPGDLPHRLVHAQIEAALAPYFFEDTP